MKKTILLLSLLSLFQYSFAQLSPPPPACPQGIVGMSSLCELACINCESIDGYTNNNGQDINEPFDFPPGFCAAEVSNPQWLGFIANTSSLVLLVSVFNCLQGEGLQMGIFQSEDCYNFTMVSNCFNQIHDGTSQTLIADNLQIGAPYYLVMDGYSNDICEFAIDVLVGSTGSTPITSIPTISGPPVVCSGTTATYSSDVDGASFYEWTFEGSVISYESQIDITFPTIAGIYELCVTPTTPCTSGSTTCTFITTTPAQVDAPQIITSTDNCLNDCTGSVLFVVDGTISDNYNFEVFYENQFPIYNISGIQDSLLLTDLCVGDYTVITGYDMGGCPDVSTFTITAATDKAEILYDQACFGEPFVLQGTINPPDPQAIYEWYFANQLVSTEQEFVTNTSGTYLLYTTDSLGCRSYPDTITVDYTFPDLSVSASDNFACPGQEVTLTASGGATYDWGIYGQGAEINVYPTQATTYTVTITDQYGCDYEESVSVNVFGGPQFELTISETDSLCLPSSVTIQATLLNNFTNYSFEWEDGSTDLLVEIDESDFGTYWSYTAVTATTQCVISDSIFVDPYQVPVLSESIYQCLSANVTSITLTAFEGLPDNLFQEFIWSSGQNTRSIQVPVPSVPTDYSVTVTLDNCTRIGNTTILPSTEPSVTISAVPLPYCMFTDVRLEAEIQGGTPPFSYDWGSFSDQDTSVIFVFADGYFSVPLTITDAAGCTTETNYQIDPYPEEYLVPEAHVGGQVFTNGFVFACQGEVININIPGAIDANWSDGQVGTSINVVATESTVLSFYGYNFLGCIVFGELFIDVVDAPPITITGNNQICLGDQTVLTAEMAGGIFFEWSTGEVGETITIAPSVSTTIFVTGITASGCANTEEYVIEVITPVIPTVDCFATESTIMFSWQDIANQDYLPSIVSGQQGMQVGNTFMVENLQPNETVILELFIITNEGCTAINQIACTTINCSGITFELEAVPPFCLDNSSNTIIPLLYTINGGSGGGTVSWQGPGIFDPNEALFDPQLAGPGIHTIIATYTDGTCTLQDQIQIEITPQLLEAPNISCSATMSSIEFSWPAINGAETYEIFDPQEGTTSATSDPSYFVDGLAPATPYTITVSALPPNGCPGTSTTIACQTEDCPGIVLNFPSDLTICANDDPFDLPLTVVGSNGGGTFTWSGPCIIDTQNGTFAPQDCGPGTYSITVIYEEGTCSYQANIILTVLDFPISDYLVNTNFICINESVTMISLNDPTVVEHIWDFDGGVATPGTGIGPHSVSWNTPGTKTVTLISVNADGCASPTFSQNIQVDPELQSLVVNCADISLTSVSFVWQNIPDATGYEVNVLTGQTGIQSGNSVTFDGLSPNETVTIEVTANTNSLCGSTSATQSCTAFDCPVFDIQVTAPALPICPTGPPIDFDASVSNGSGTGTFTWSGPGIIDAANGIFDPTIAGPGIHNLTVNYFEDPCPGMASVTIEVADIETSEFTITPDLLCIDGTTQIIYTGSADASAVFSWDFDGGIATPGVGAGPHTVSWADAGTKEVSLQVIVDGCAGDLTTNTVTVETPLAEPVITCTTTTTSILFEWADVAGSTDYMVTVLTGQTGTQSGNSYLLENLMPNEEVTIEVSTISSSPCGSSTATLTCLTSPCPNYTLEITAPTHALCVYDNPITLTGIAQGSNNSGQFVWLGTGIDPLTGVFDPQLSGAGVFDLMLTYTEGFCEYAESITVEVFEQPTASFTVENAVCINSSATVVYSGNASNAAVYEWNFDGGVIQSGSGAGPYEVSWDVAGDYSISLMVTENGCISESFEQQLTVNPDAAPPVISCAQVTVSSLAFNWPIVAGTTYTINVINGPNFILIDEGNILFEGLNPEQTVEIEIIATPNNGCAPASATASCTTLSCPAVDITLPPDFIICVEQGDPFIINVLIDGQPSNQGLTFSGPGIVDPFTGLFNPLLAGEGQHTISVLYMDGPCSYTDSFVLGIRYPKTLLDLNTNCTSDGSAYTVTYSYFNHIFNGDTTFVESDPIPSGTPYSFELSTFPNCVLDTIEVVNDCNCPGSPGTMLVTSNSCNPETVAAQHAGDEDIPTGSGLYFVLHTNPGNVLTDIRAISQSPEFSLGPDFGMDEQYYISAVLFELDGNNEPILEGNCTKVAEGVPVAFTESINLQLEPQVFLCDGSAIQLEASYSGNASISWLPASGLSCTTCANPFASPSATTTYTVEATNSFGCTEQAETVVYVDELPNDIWPAEPITVCQGDLFEICLPDALSYTWTGPSNYFSIDQCLVWPEFDAEYAGIYTIELELDNGCILSETLELVAPPALMLNAISEDRVACPTDVFLLSADFENAVQYNWYPISNVLTPDSSATLAYANGPTNFTVIVQDEFGCYTQEVVFVGTATDCTFDPDTYVPPLGSLQSGSDQVEKRSQDTPSAVEEAIDLKVFPVPASEQMNLTITGTLLEQISLYNMQGSLLRQYQTNGQQMQLDVNDLPAGTYLLKVLHTKGLLVQKILVIHN